MPARDFRYHLLSIGVNREANGATVRSAERDAFGISWTFAQLGYWRAERNRCLTGAQATRSRDRRASRLLRRPRGSRSPAPLLERPPLHASIRSSKRWPAPADARLRVLIVDTCHADDRMQRLGAGARDAARRPPSRRARLVRGRRARAREQRQRLLHRRAAAPAAPAAAARREDARSARRVQPRGGRCRSAAPAASRSSRPTAPAGCASRSSRQTPLPFEPL